MKAEMIKETACKPEERFNRIEKGIKNIFDYKNSENILDVDIHVDRDLQIVHGNYSVLILLE